MGFQDRDDGREHHRRNAEPMWSDVRRVPQRRTPLLGIVLIWLLVALALLFAVDRWVMPLFAPDRAASRNSQADMPSGNGGRPQPTPGEAATRPARPAMNSFSGLAPESPSNPIYRCGNAYGMTPCANGRTVDGPAASGFDSRPSQKLAQLVASGRTNEDTTTYTNGSAAIAASSNNGECGMLAAELLNLDADARRAHPTPYLDWLRARRQHVRDRQAAMHC